ncbi:MAG TPA: MFS transporter [Candidatus Acidoferrales bacterium]|nr:MFS transporter [Candidatus Acidoferrales bacterium]
MTRSSPTDAAEIAPGRHSDPKRTTRLPGMIRALQHRNFQLFFSGQLISLIGTWMQNIAQAWLVYRLTNSSWLLGVVGFLGQIPVFLLAPVGGTVADRWNRQRVVIGTQTSSMILALILAWLTLADVVRVWEIMVLAAMLGAVNAFDIPARQAFLVDMVGKDDLMNAIALNSSMFNGARVIGPAIAGILVASIGEGWCFFANGVSYIAVIAGLFLMRLNIFEKKKEGSPVEHIVEGFKFVHRTRPIWALLLLLGVVSLVATPYSVLMPIFADRILHGGARALGVLMGAAGVGALMAALTLAMKRGLKGLSRWVVLSCAGFGVSLICFAFSKNYLLSILLLVPVGFAVMLQMASSNTLIQSMVPDDFRGRTMAVYSMMFMGMAPLGSLFAGGLAAKIGAPWTLAIGGLGAIAGAAVFARHLPKLRVEARELLIAQGMAGGEPADTMTARASE